MKYSRVIVLVMLIVPVTVFAFVKPAKIVFPKLAGAECITEWICIDDTNRFKEAESLYISSLSEIEGTLTKFKKRPTVVFCSSQECFSAFGFNKAAGKSIAGSGVVIGPRGWKPHYVKHDLFQDYREKYNHVYGQLKGVAFKLRLEDEV